MFKNNFHSVACINYSYLKEGLYNSYVVSGLSKHIKLDEAMMSRICLLLNDHGMNLNVYNNYDLCNVILLILSADLTFKEINELIIEIFNIVLERSIESDDEEIICQNELEAGAKLGKIITLYDNDNCSDLELIFNSCIQYYMSIMGGYAELGCVITLFLNRFNRVSNVSYTNEQLISWIKENISKYSISKSYVKYEYDVEIKKPAAVYKYSITVKGLVNTRVNVSYPMVISPRLFRYKNGEYYGGTVWNTKYCLHPLVKPSEFKDINISTTLIRIVENIQNIPLEANTTVLNEIILSLEGNIKYIYDSKLNAKGKVLAVNTLKYKIEHLKELISYLNKYNIKKLYFPLVLCFRGRIYANSLISYTSNVELRKLKFHDSSSEIVEYDATCNMLQILSIILGSHKMMENTNVLDDIIPSDPYSFFTPKSNYTEQDYELMLNNISIYIKDNNIRRSVAIESFKSTLAYIDRNLIKKTIMTWLYGSNMHSILKRMIAEGYKNIKYDTILLIISKFYVSYKEECNNLKLINKFNKAIIDNGCSWNINTGSISFNNAYISSKNKSIRLTLNDGEKIRVSYKTITDKIDTRSSSISLLPNLAHSLDAYTVFIAKGLSLIHPTLNLKTIHDAFLTTEEHENLIKRIYATSLYSIKLFLCESMKTNINKIKWYNEITNNLSKPKGVHNKTYQKQINLINDINNLILNIENNANYTKSLKSSILNSKHILKANIPDEK